MLAHFEHLDFFPLLEYLNVGHVLLLHLLDCNFLARHFVNGKLDKTKLALAQCLVEIIKLEHVYSALCFLKLRNPFFLFTQVREEDQARFVRRDYKLDWVERLCSLRMLVFSLLRLLSRAVGARSASALLLSLLRLLRHLSH